jgi:glycosyltransferase involved in cell wall biosynthesis
MRVAWDLQAVTGPRPTGLGASVRLLLEAVKQYAPDVDLVGLAPNSHEIALKSVNERVLWEQFRLPAALWSASRKRGLDLHYTPALGAPLAAVVPVVTHVHDLIPLMFPGQFHGWAQWYWERLLPGTWRRSKALTVSNASLIPQVAQLLHYPERQIHVVPYYPDPRMAQLAQQCAGDQERSGAAPPSPAPVFCTLASHEPRKNIELAIRAVGRLKRERIAVRLVCVGGTTAHTEVLRQLALTEKVGGQVEFPGYLEQQQIAGLLLASTALLFVSRYEGYGMPPQEAQSIGCAVVLSDIACHRAVYDDAGRWAQVDAALRHPPPFVAVDDVNALAQQMSLLIGDEQYVQQLRRSGSAYQATFSAEATAAALRQAFESALDR